MLFDPFMKIKSSSESSAQQRRHGWVKVHWEERLLKPPQKSDPSLGLLLTVAGLIFSSFKFLFVFFLFCCSFYKEQ